MPVPFTHSENPMHRAAPSSVGRITAHADRSRTHNHLSVDGVSVAYGTHRVLTDISFTAAAADRIGLVGENGTGKSTLLRIIAGVQHPDGGAVQKPGSVGILHQEITHPENTSIAEVLDKAQSAELAVIRRLEQLGEELSEHPEDPVAADAYATLLDEAERIGAWRAEAHRGEVVAGLGLAPFPESTTLGTLSGGWRLRVALAALLLEAPHVLLLDEPSNHLDDASVTYLERVLANWPGIVIIASHDRALLDAVTTKTLDLDPLPRVATDLADAADDTATAENSTGSNIGSGYGIHLWGLRYSDARAARERELQRWRERYRAEQDQLAALRHEIDVGSREVNRKHESKSEVRMARKFYADKDARVTARRARNARVRLETLERERIRRPPTPLTFGGFDRFDHIDGAAPTPEAAPSPREPSSPDHEHEPLLRADRVRVDGRLRETTLDVRHGDRVLVTGPNGSGKSTLLAVLAGALAPSAGTVDRNARIGFLPQEATFDRDDLPAETHYRQLVGETAAERTPLQNTGLLAPRDASRPVRELSVGQRRRLALAAFVADPPPLLLLDEPTNHLSLTLVEELEQALIDYPGAIIVATHDRWIRDRWAEKFGASKSQRPRGDTRVWLLPPENSLLA